ncbi:hypothetical protein NL676_029970 [Syzygium grande]|nr:hypothetical protein NL676_029970 [Syzygium grande]
MSLIDKKDKISDNQQQRSRIGTKKLGHQPSEKRPAKRKGGDADDDRAEVVVRHTNPPHLSLTLPYLTADSPSSSCYLRLEPRSTTTLEKKNPAAFQSSMATNAGNETGVPTIGGGEWRRRNHLWRSKDRIVLLKNIAEFQEQKKMDCLLNFPAFNTFLQDNKAIFEYSYEPCEIKTKMAMLKRRLPKRITKSDFVKTEQDETLAKLYKKLWHVECSDEGESELEPHSAIPPESAPKRARKASGDGAELSIPPESSGKRERKAGGDGAESSGPGKKTKRLWSKIDKAEIRASKLIFILGLFLTKVIFEYSYEPCEIKTKRAMLKRRLPKRITKSDFVKTEQDEILVKLYKKLWHVEDSDEGESELEPHRATLPVSFAKRERKAGGDGAEPPLTNQGASQ